MSLQENLQQQLDLLDAANHFEAGPQTIEVSDEKCCISVELSAVGNLGCAVNEMTIQSQQLAEIPLERLKEIGQELASRITYLLEPIATIEVDTDEGAVQLRSDPPHRVAHTRSYYELIARQGGKLTLCRFNKEPKQPRDRVPAQLTREVLARLIDDFTAVIE